MSLIDQAASERNVHKMRLNETAGTAPAQKMIIQPSELLSIMRAVLDDSMLDKKTKKAWDSYRKKIKTARWTLAGTLGSVHGDLWKEQIDVTLHSMVKNIVNSQPNGEWKLFDYEVDIRTGIDNVEAIVLACEWVDARNEQDLRYANGVPAVDVHVDVSNSNKELIEALNSRQESSNDEELKDLMKQFIATMASNAIEKSKSEPIEKAEKPVEESDNDFSEGFEG
tara:strand:- start:8 stop:682 length:675 start_codon:yes stop_codon:yes gene_type:complete